MSRTIFKITVWLTLVGILGGTLLAAAPPPAALSAPADLAPFDPNILTRHRTRGGG